MSGLHDSIMCLYSTTGTDMCTNYRYQSTTLRSHLSNNIPNNFIWSENPLTHKQLTAKFSAHNVLQPRRILFYSYVHPPSLQQTIV